MAGDRIRTGLGLPKLEGKEREEALRAEGPSWREYFYFSFAKTWMLLLFFIVDVWVAAIWLQPRILVAPLVVTVGVAVYLEFLAYRALWYRPHPEQEDLNRPFRPTWTRPTRFGRWTPEAWRQREGRDPFPSEPRRGPDPREFV